MIRETGAQQTDARCSWGSETDTSSASSGSYPSLLWWRSSHLAGRHHCRNCSLGHRGQDPLQAEAASRVQCAHRRRATGAGASPTLPGCPVLHGGQPAYRPALTPGLPMRLSSYQARRGEAAGLPTYLDHGRTVSVPMPTLPQAAYDPEAAAYHARIDGQQHGSWANAPHDPSLPSYDLAPPKYDFTQDSAAGTTATTTTAAPVVTTPGGGMEMAETGRSAPVLTTPLPSPAAPLGASDNAPSMFPVSSPATAPTSPGEMHDVSLADRPSLTPRVSANATTGTILRQ
jgi:hypothetical protein